MPSCISRGEGRGSACIANHLFICMVNRVGIIWIIQKSSKEQHKAWMPSSLSHIRLVYWHFKGLSHPIGTFDPPPVIINGLSHPWSTTCHSPGPEGQSDWWSLRNKRTLKNELIIRGRAIRLTMNGMVRAQFISSQKMNALGWLVRQTERQTDGQKDR